MTFRFAVLLLAGAGIAAVAGCTSASSTSTTPPAADASNLVSSAPVTSSAAAASTATAGTTAPPPAATPTTSAPVTGFLDATIGVPPGAAQLSLSGTPLEFSVTLTNGTSHAYTDITPVVSIGHCTCASGGAQLAPKGTLAYLAGGSWRSTQYDTEGLGTDFLTDVQVGSVTLAPGATATWTFRVAFTPGQSGYAAGRTSLDLTVVQLPAHKQIGASPAASVPVTVTA
jgi:hypothetical protein